jgi:hypothetical protein
MKVVLLIAAAVAAISCFFSLSVRAGAEAANHGHGVSSQIVAEAATIPIDYSTIPIDYGRANV